MKKVLIIYGGSRSNGNTMQAISKFIQNSKQPIEVVDLSQTNLTYYDHNHKNKKDDFLKIATKMTEADIIVFATPVYWYSMSAQLKTFFDRLTDLIQIRKDLGRKLRGKNCYLICSGTGKTLPNGFEMPFDSTCKYFDMIYKGHFYHHVVQDGLLSKGSEKAIKKFAKSIF